MPNDHDIVTASEIADFVFGAGTGTGARFNRQPCPARRQEWSGQAEVVPRPESLPRTETNAGPELSRVADLNPAFLGGDAVAGY
jgi:hypothetical protein